MRNMIRRITAILTFSAIVLTSLSAMASASEVSYDMITPVSSQKVTFDAGDATKDRHLSGSASTSAVNGDNTAKIVADPADTNGYCYYMGDVLTENNCSSHGIAFGSDAFDNTSNGKRQRLAGVGKLIFDMYIAPVNDDGNNKVTMMYIRGTSSKNVGDIKFQSKTLSDGSRAFQVTAATSVTTTYNNTDITPVYTTDTTTRTFPANKWYTCTLSINVPKQTWQFEMKDRVTNEVAITIDVAGFGVNTESVRCVEFVIGADRPKIYVDNYQFTREAYILCEPTVVKEGNGYTASVTVKNEASTITAPPTLILAVYDEQGKLVDINWDNNDEVGEFVRVTDDYSTLSLGTTTLSCSVGEGYTAQAFIWNNLSTLVPYITPVTPVAE